MSVQLTWWIGDRDPSYADTIKVGGVGVDLTSKTCTFKMRLVGSSTLKVNQPVSTKDALGNFTYAWGATDMDTEGTYLVWVETLTGGGRTQTLYENIIRVESHTAGSPRVYVEPAELKSTLEIVGKNYDQDVRLACIAASRGMDKLCKRRFFPDIDASQVRIYSPDSSRFCITDDIVTLTSLKVDRSGTNNFSETWTLGTEFVLEPVNAPREQPIEPWRWVQTRTYGNRYFPDIEQSVQVIAKFGWPECPPVIKHAATILAGRLMKRAREVPLGILELGSVESGYAIRIGRNDPDVNAAVEEYTRRRPF